MDVDHERCYRAVKARDARFDGVFYTAVRTTGIYCRPSCPATTPRPENVRFFTTAAAAQDQGYRACRRCRPDTTPGSPAWNVRADAVGRAMRLIGDGVVEREGVTGLASRLGYSTRHLSRLLTDEVGAGPLALARSNRAHTARVLIETTTLPMADIAFASGFSSVRQFNDSVRQAYAATPRELRRRRGGGPTGRLRIRLAVREPFAADDLVAFLAARAVPGLESVTGRTYARVVTLPHGAGVLEVALHDDHVECELELTDLRDTAVAVSRARHLLDLDADPVAIDAALGEDPALAPLVAEQPGLRLPGHVDGFELAVRAVVGQQVSVAGARTLLARLVEAHGTPVDLALGRRHGLTHAFVTPEQLLGADRLAMPASRQRALTDLAAAVGDGSLDLTPGAERDVTRARLLAVRGIGPWTAGYIAMRALGDPDVLLDTDLVVRRELIRRGIGDAARTEAWHPWRSYATMHLWRVSARPERILV